MSFSNSVLHHQPGAAERVEVVNSIDIDLTALETTATEIKTEVEAGNIVLGEVKTAIEALDFSLDLTTLEGDVAGIKAELEPLTDKELALTVTASEVAVVEVSVSSRTTLTAWVSNTGGTNALDFKLVRYADATTDFSRVIVDWSEVSASSSAVPIDIIAFPGRYVVELRSTAGTTANAALQAGG